MPVNNSSACGNARKLEARFSFNVPMPAVTHAGNKECKHDNDCESVEAHRDGARDTLHHREVQDTQIENISRSRRRE